MRKTDFAMEAKDIAKKLGLSFQQVRWAEESALRKLREHPEFRAALKILIETGEFDGYFSLDRKADEQ